ncbi:hypothetical protein ABT256_00615 [Amycolatopsis japonica]|uniref:hypothetical protein n=1 Tax=Amycolatopsis japonica TaxID=208439 RepID=UPI0033287819
MNRILSAIGVSAGVLLGSVMLPGLASAEPSALPSDAQVAGAQADLCASKVTSSGYVHIYWNTGCNSQPICSTTGDDSNYGNSQGCAGDDDNRATSLLNNGYSGGLDDVRFYRLADHGGGSVCVGNQQYVSNLANWSFTSGINADNRISSHKWVSSC